jgi:opacity protein-like surface antigen
VAEYKFTHFKFDHSGSSGTISNDINTHHLTAGVALHF